MDAEVLKHLRDFMAEAEQDYDINISELCNRLRQDRIPVTPTPNKKQMKIVKRALCAMIAISFTFHDKAKSDPTIISRLVEGWPDIWAWMTFLHQKCIIDPVYSAIRRIVSVRVIPHFLVAFGFNQRLRKAITGTCGVMAMLGSHWVQEDVYLELMKSRPLFSGASLILLQHEDDEDRNRLADEFLAAAADQGTVVRVAIEHLRDALLPPSSQSSWNVIRIHLQLINIFSSTPLRNALLRESSLVDTVVDVLRQLNSAPFDIAPPQFVGFILVPLIEIFRSINGLSWLIRAVEAGVIECILQADTRLELLPSEFSSHLSQEIFKPFYQHLVYRSFLRSLDKVLKTIGQTRFAANESNILWTSWLGLKARMQDMWQFKIKFDDELKSGSYSSLCGCGYTKCFEKKVTRKCTGCQSTVYCSTICQKNDWPTHRTSCRNWEREAKPLSKHDREFLNFIVNHELPLRMSESEIRKHPSIPLHQLVFEMDYVSIPMEVRWHHRVDTVRFGTEEEIAGLNSLVREAREGDIIVRPLVRWGEATWSFPMVYRHWSLMALQSMLLADKT